MLKTLRIATTLLILSTLLTGVAYPLAVTAVAQIAFPRQANGSVIVKDNQIVGSSLLGQAFEGDAYFWSRPSATGPFAYNGGSSSGSNLGPTNPDYLKSIAERVEAIKKAHPDESGPVPADLVTASASGLDPHISPAAAIYQARRVAQARKLSLDPVLHLISNATEDKTFGVLGEPRVNVLKLNLALDAVK